jgi:hypothetical protein
MILRTWSARLESSRVAAYLHVFTSQVKPALVALPGFLGSTVMERRLHEAPSPSTPVSEVVVQTRWSSLDAIRGFAGDDLSVAVIEPEAAALLLEYDRTVRHYEILDESGLSA